MGRAEQGMEDEEGGVRRASIDASIGAQRRRKRGDTCTTVLLQYYSWTGPVSEHMSR